jgi:hypothetical protein
MAILSETTICRYLQRGEIIIEGDENYVRGSSYSCHALKVIPGGDDQEDEPISVDFSAVGAPDVYRVPPRQLVWVLIKETVNYLWMSAHSGGRPIRYLVKD